jgi:hypothetical protein
MTDRSIELENQVNMEPQKLNGEQGVIGRLQDRVWSTAISYRTDPGHYLKRGVEAGIVAFAATPGDEALRYLAFGATHAATEGNSIASGAVFGATTLLTQGVAAVAAADILDGDGARRTITKTNSKIRKILGKEEDEPIRELPAIAQAGLAMLGGTAMLLTARQLTDPTRTYEVNKRFGLKVAGAMAAYFAIEETVVSQAINEFGVPRTVGGLALAVVGAGVIYQRVTRKAVEKSERSYETFSEWQDKNQKGLRIGVYHDELHAALSDKDTLSLKTKDEVGKKIRIPVLTPIEQLEWFNQELVEKRFGTERNVYVYTHPPYDIEGVDDKISKLLEEVVNRGDIVLTEVYSDDTESPVSKFIESARQDIGTDVEAFGTEELPSRVDFFEGIADVTNGEGTVHNDMTFYDALELCKDEGLVTIDPLNGPDIIDIIEGEEAERIWNLYEGPFYELGVNDPTLAGFDHDTLIEILRDPNIVKFVNRVDGKISTMMMYLNDFSKAPWFNEQHYRTKYPEYFDTGNIIMFTGIVSDENMRGNNYGVGLLELMADVVSRRGTDVMVIMECTEISTMYIPNLGKAALEANGSIFMSGMESPVAQIEYFAVSKKS